MYGMLSGGGVVLQVQLLAVLALAASACLWLFVFLRSGRRRLLSLILVPVVLWLVFGALDFMVTAQGVYESPLKEKNPVARFMFSGLGLLGPAASAFLWVSLWSALSLLLDFRTKGVLPEWLRDFSQLGIFYSLAAGHLLAFLSWIPEWGGIVGWSLNSYRVLPLLSGVDLAYFPWIILGFTLAGVHLLFLCSRRRAL